MKVTLLGTGTPTNPNRFQSGVLVEIGGSKLLFDAGRGTVHQMYQAGVEIKQVNPVFITHHHFDHINDLFDVIISTAMAGRTECLDIYGPAGTQAIVTALLEQVYAQDIRFRLEEDKDIKRKGGSWQEQPEAISRVNVKDIGRGLVAKTDNWAVFSDYVLHGDFAHAPGFEWHCLGYRIEAEGKIVTISGDTVYCEGIINLAKDVDLLVQCCHLPKSDANTPLMKYLTTSILPSSGDVGRIGAEAGVKKMVLTHMSATITAGNSAEIEADVRQDYAGELLLGHDLMEIEV
ncbi:MAG: ribonuclease BN (tRNA processing enzyme) [Candidatus Promineifilaceae bacterium]|jgi:ribonuclease BN (tRNA processing enzyme)